MVYDNSLTTSQIWDNYLAAIKAVPTIEKPFTVDDYNYPITNDTTQWTKGYFHEVSSCLNTNFNGKRYKNVLEVRDHLRKEGDAEFQPK